MFAPSSAAMAHLEAKASSWSAKIQSISTECISPSVEAAWRREKDGCQLSAYLGVSHKASSTSLGQQAEGSACSGTAACTGSVLALESAEVAWSFLCIDTGRGSFVRILDGVCTCMLDGQNVEEQRCTEAVDENFGHAFMTQRTPVGPCHA